MAPNELLAVNGIELRHLRALVALAEESHYGRAATRLRLAQSTLSRTLTDLEGLVGLRLVEREQRVFGLTDAGQTLLHAAEQALIAVQDGLVAARSTGTAPTVGFVGAYGYRWLASLRRRLGLAAFGVRDLSANHGLARVLDGVDLAVMPLPLVDPPSLEHRTLTAADCWIALPRHHRLADAQTIEFPRIAREPLLLPTGDALWRDHLQVIFRAHGVDMRPGPAVRSMSECLAEVEVGSGWTIAPARGDFRAWEGVALRQATGLERVRIAAVWDPARHTATAARLVDELVAVADGCRTAVAA